MQINQAWQKPRQRFTTTRGCDKKCIVASSESLHHVALIVTYGPALIIKPILKLWRNQSRTYPLVCLGRIQHVIHTYGKAKGLQEL